MNNNVIYGNDAISYNVLLDDVRVMISNLGNIGIEVGRYNTLVDRIDDELKKELDKRVDMRDNSLDGEIDNVVNFGLESIYGTAINRLKKIKSGLEKYDWCFIISKFTDYVNSGVDKNNIDDISSRAVDCMKIINGVRIIDYDEVSDVLEKFYDAIYLLIKMEVVFDKRNLFDFVSNNYNYSSVIDDRVRKEIKDNNLYEVDKIKVLCNKLDSEGLNASYLNRYLIGMVLLETSDKDVILPIKKEIEDISKQFFDKNRYIVVESRNVRDFSSRIDRIRDRFYEVKNKFLKNTVAFSLSGVFVLTSCVGLVRSILMMSSSFNTRTVTWTQGDNEPNIIDNDNTFDGYGDGIYLKECSPYYLNSRGEYTRKVDIYSYYTNKEVLSSADIQNLLSLDFADNGRYIETIYEYTEDLSVVNSYDVTIKEVVEAEFNFSDEALVLFLISMFGLAVSAGVQVAVWKEEYKSSIAEYKYVKKDYIKKKEEYDEEFVELLELVKSNEELRDRFNKAYNDFVSKCGESDELKNIYDEINGVSYSKIKERKK